MTLRYAAWLLAIAAACIPAAIQTASTPWPARPTVFRGGTLGVGVEVHTTRAPLRRLSVTVRCFGRTKVRGGARVRSDGRVVLDDAIRGYLRQRGIGLEAAMPGADRVDVTARVPLLGTRRATLLPMEAPGPRLLSP